MGRARDLGVGVGDGTVCIVAGLRHDSGALNQWPDLVQSLDNFTSILLGLSYPHIKSLALFHKRVMEDA